MSLIIAFDNNDNLKVSDAVAAKGLNKLQAAPSSVHAYAIPTTIQIAYAQYKNLLPAYMRAYAERKRVDVSLAFHPIQFKAGDTFPMSYPDIAIEFKQSVPSEVMDKLKTVGYQEIKYQNNNILILRTPTSDTVKFIMGTAHNKECPAPQNTVNTSCLQALMTIRKIFSAFYCTHHYPAFESEDHAKTVETWILAPNERKRTQTNEPAGPASKRPRTRTQANSEADEDANMNDDTSEDHTTPTERPIAYAIPPPPCARGWGPLEDLPNNVGVYSPFIPELAAYDSKMVLSVIHSYFLGCLGHDTSSVKAAVELLRSRLTIISKTEQGMVLAHMAKCIDLGIMGQCRVYPIFEGEVYTGSAILGARVNYVINRETISPVDSTALREKIRNFGSHKWALEGIVRLAGVPPEQVAAVVNNITSMTMLRMFLHESHISESIRDEISRIAVQLRFGRSWAINPTTLTNALTLIANSDTKLPDDFPLHHSKLFEKDRVAVVWSAFGESAPSFAHPGKKYDVAKNDHPKHIGCRTGVPLNDAIADMRSILRTREVAVPALSRRSGVYTERIFTGNDASGLWSVLAKACGVSSQVVAGASAAENVVAEGVFDDY